jgi:UDP-N-acetylmuramoyl-tripeptide--D-alanyl-D-alanine ligase
MKDAILKLIYRILRSYAHKVILHHNPRVVAVTGSVGKTSTKESITAVMKENFGDQVRSTHGNLNAEIGIPLTILGYTKMPSKISWPIILILAWFKTFTKTYPKYLILEMGVEHPGDIEYFGSIVSPEIGIITAVTPAHVINFKSLSEMQSEKIKMSQILEKNGLLIYNLDDEYLSKQNFKNGFSYSIKKEKSDCKASGISLSDNGMEYLINYKNEKINLKSRLLGEHLVYADLAAFCVGKYFGISSEKIVLSLEKGKPIAGRMNLLNGRNGIKIIDDTYNSNPASACAALDTLADIKYGGRKVAIIGNMNELGATEKESHIELAKYAKGKFDLVIFSGQNAKIMYDAYGDKKTSRKYNNRREIINQLDQIIKPDDLVLIKASQNKNFFEEVTKELLQNRDEAKDVLVRQDKFWHKKKKYSH